MSAYEQGIKAFSDGVAKDQNQFNKQTQSGHWQQWNAGWDNEFQKTMPADGVVVTRETFQK